MGFIGEAIGGLFGKDEGPDRAEIAARSKRKAIMAATKEIMSLKRKQGFSSTLFAGSYKPPKELQTLFAQDASKTKTILGG